MSKITNQIFGKFYDKEIVLTTLSDKDTSVSIMNWGATIQNWTVYQSTEKQSSVVLGFESFDLYPKFSPFFGSIVGRVINRINRGSFELNGNRHQLDINRPPNHLHGGIKSFGKSIWDYETDEKNNLVKYSIKSNDGDGGYPGNVHAHAKYKLKEHKLYIEMTANVDRETPINMGQHNYFNLCSNSEKSYNVCNHILFLNSKSYTETDQNLIPTGKIIPTSNTNMDFFNKKKIGNIELDDNYVLEKNNNLNTTAAQLFNPANNLNLNLWTDQPGIQVYNAYKLNLLEKGLNGLIYKNFAGICLEDQKFPDSVNHSHFPSIISSPEKPYLHQSVIEIL